MQMLVTKKALLVVAIGAVSSLLMVTAGCATSTPPAASSGPAQVTPGGQNMTKLPGTATWNLEAVGSPPDAWKGKPFEVPMSGRFVLTGWAVDSQTKTPASAVVVTVDGAAFPAQYGTPRADVATYFNTPAYANCGYKLDLPANQFSAGSHTLFARVISSDGKSYWEMGPYTAVFK